MNPDDPRRAPDRGPSPPGPRRADIVLTALNAGYAHSAFGLRYLQANLGDLIRSSAVLEFESGTRTPEIAEAVLALEPKVVGIGVYIWNATEAAALAAELKALRPGLKVVLGGPQLAGGDPDGIFRAADYLVIGEGELAFADLCRRLLAGDAPAERVINAPAPEPDVLSLPYRLYTDADIAGRVIYAESSRGCPFACDFCLSAVGGPVRTFSLPRLFEEWGALMDRGARRFKFVDRTFNLDAGRATAILEFFLARAAEGLFLHFEVVPDRFPEELFGLIGRFPPGALQLELGVQTFDEAVARRIGRRQDNAAVERNIRRLRAETGAHLHADLIIGLPGEGLEGFGAGFDRLFALGPHEIQVGTLKRLPGAPIAKHDAAWGMVYGRLPPFELRENALLDFFTMQRLRRFARYWEMVANSGVFPEAAGLLLRGASPFRSFLGFSDWLSERAGRTYAISRERLRAFLHAYLTEALGVPASEAASALERDALRASRAAKRGIPPRQALHHPAAHPEK